MDSYNIGTVRQYREVDGKMWGNTEIHRTNEREEEEERWRQIHLEIVSASVWPLAYWN